MSFAEEAPIRYDAVGRGVPLLLVHGFPLDRTIWRHQADGLQDDARLIVPDLRGFGESRAAAGVVTMDEYAADLEVVLDWLGLERVVVCGLSMGGYVALALLARSPGRIAGLVLANTRSGADSEEARQGRVAAAERVLSDGVAGMAASMLPKLFAEATLSQRPELAEGVRRMMARQRPAGVAAALLGMAERPDRTPTLKGLEVPMLVITGSDDSLIPVSESEAMAAAVPGSELVIVRGAGHLANVEDPRAFNAALRRFVETISP